jgi:two-component system phosphate regulon sensor histidine kinase PhoR/two-component system sensor histidine kinase VicK
MAIKIHEFFEHYKRETIALFVLAQLFSVTVGGFGGWLGWQVLYLQPIAAFIFAVLIMSISNILISLFMFKTASTPLKIMSQAVAHVSKDPVITPPPDITKPHYEYTGLKAMVQTIYELAIAAHPTAQDEEATISQPQADFFQHVADTMPCGIIVINAANKIIYANELAPVSKNPDGNLDIKLIFEQNDDLAKWLADCQANKVHDSHFWQRVSDRLPSEEDRKIYDVASHYQKNDGSGVEVVLVALDRTSAYAPDQDDMDFIALAAHELRGPITVIRGYLDVLNQEVGEKLDAEQRILMARLQVSAERLSGYVSNILNVSRFDRRRFSMHLHEDNLLSILQNLVSDLNLRAQTQNRSLVFEIPDNLPTIAADRTGISEVVTNLIDNAIKYSHEGGKVITRAALKDGFVEVTINDAGIGMPDNIVGNLFNKFYRSHRSRESVGGTGLGLYICKAIVEAHGGTIWVRSQEGKGTTFGFTVPVYSTVAQKIASGDNKDITERSEGWIKNHAMYRR